MPDFFQLSAGEQREALSAVADQSGRPIHLLEKDIWVVWSLQQLFNGPHADHLVFKGGTSLSKAYKVIRRFSEDVDLTYDIRAIAGDLVGNGPAPLPATNSQEKKWTSEIRKRLSAWVSEKVIPELSRALGQKGLPAVVRADGEKAFIEYKALASGTGYVKPIVMLEFGARSTGEPSEPRSVVCDAAEYLRDVQFPTATPKVMRPERTFWEKATAIHVYCVQGVFRGGKGFARHWHDVARLDDASFAMSAVADKDLARAVADHKSRFFSENDPKGLPIDYHAAVSGSLQLVPSNGALEALAEDYRQMVEDGLLLDDAEEFDTLIRHCRDIQTRVNKKAKQLEASGSN